MADINPLAIELIDARSQLADRDEQIVILRSKLRTQGRIITTICQKQAKMRRYIWKLEHKAKGQPTPRAVRKLREIRDAAGTNSNPKIIDLIEAGQKAEGI